MITMNFFNVLADPDAYVEEIESGGWKVIEAEAGEFRGIQERGMDELAELATVLFPEYEITLNFVRKSPLHQEEPHYIHTDDMHGDRTVILYLNKTYPEGYGTTLYDNNETPILINQAQYNSAFIFESNVKHSRNIKLNFGSQNDARMVQVLFLKLKDE
tara:strand:+ start:4972 stop:5448 length:477 start_codon:yes stop_codon:yes gene_type:complete